MMQEHTTEPPRRPLAITLIAIIIGIGGGVSFSFTLLLLSTGNTQSHVFVGGWLALLMAACVRGFWLMRSWAYFLFIGVALITQVGAYTAGNLHILSMLLPALIIAVSTLYLGRMTKLRLFERLFGSADNAGRSVRIARWGFVISVLLVLYTLAKLGSSNNVEFEVIDSELKALIPSSKTIFWLDNETLIFFGGWRKDEPMRRLKKGEKKEWGVVAWNYKTDRIDLLIEDIVRLCYDSGTLYFQDGAYSKWHKGDITSGQDGIKLSDIEPVQPGQYLLRRGLHCSMETKGDAKTDLIANLKGFDGSIRKVWSEDITEEQRRISRRYMATYFSPDFPEGRPLIELRGLLPVIQHIEHKDSYLLTVGKKSDKQYKSLTLVPYERWALKENGSMSVIPVPEGWDLSSSVHPTVKGAVVIHRDMRKRKPGAEDRGAYLITGPGRRDVMELLHGKLDAARVSPDGCKVAAAHYPKTLPLGKYRTTLKVIDLCVSRDKD